MIKEISCRCGKKNVCFMDVRISVFGTRSRSTKAYSSVLNGWLFTNMSVSYYRVNNRNSPPYKFIANTTRRS